MTYTSQNFHPGSHTNMSITDLLNVRAMDEALVGGVAEVFDVSGHGAVGDGDTDDTAAIQAAIDAASDETYGGVVYFPAGRYLISSTLTVRSHNIVLRGIGNAAPLSPDWGGSQLYCSGVGFNGTYMIEVKLAGTPTEGVQGFRIDGMSLYIDGGDNADVGGIYADTTRSFFTNTKIIGNGYNGLSLDTSAGIGGTGNYDNVVSECAFYFSGRGAHGGASLYINSTDNQIFDNTFYAFDQYAIHLSSTATHQQISGNRFDSETGAGAVGGPGIFAETAGGLCVVDNSFSRCRGAIRIVSTAVWGNLTCCNNRFTAPETASDDNTLDAIYIANSNTVYGALISDNQFFSTSDARWRYGINVVDNKLKNLVIGPMADCTPDASPASAFGTAVIKNTGSTIQTVPRVIGQSGASSSHTGDTNIFTLGTVVVPAHAMGLNGRLVVTALFSRPAGGTSSNTLSLNLGSTALWIGTATTAQRTYRVQIEVVNRDALNSQVFGPTGQGGFGTDTNPPGTSAEDTSGDLNLTMKCQLGNSGDTAVLESYLVELIPG